MSSGGGTSGTSPGPTVFLSSRADDKRALRRQVRRRRDELALHDRETWSLRSVEHLISSGLLDGVQVLAAYAPIRSEADPGGAVEWHLKRGGQVAFPRVCDNLLKWFIATPSTLVPTPPWSIPEPVEAVHTAIAERDIDAWIVPGLAFTQEGHRLGYGRGHYDRALSAASAGPSSKAPIRIGFAFSVQIEVAIPVEAHDRPMSAVVTERGVLGRA